jgi:hypothetical protein
MVRRSLPRSANQTAILRSFSPGAATKVRTSILRGALRGATTTGQLSRACGSPMILRPASHAWPPYAASSGNTQATARTQGGRPAAAVLAPVLRDKSLRWCALALRKRRGVLADSELCHAGATRCQFRLLQPECAAKGGGKRQRHPAGVNANTRWRDLRDRRPRLRGPASACTIVYRTLEI